MKLEKACKDAELDTSGLRKYDLSRRSGEFVNVSHAVRSSLALGLLAFLRGPSTSYERRNMKTWRDDSIAMLVQKGAFFVF